jgi:hypothetical protein
MSAPHDQEHWLDRNWQVLLILFGILFVTLLVSFHPTLWS